MKSKRVNAISNNKQVSVKQSRDELKYHEELPVLAGLRRLLLQHSPKISLGSRDRNFNRYANRNVSAVSFPFKTTKSKSAYVPLLHERYLLHWQAMRVEGEMQRG